MVSCPAPFGIPSRAEPLPPLLAPAEHAAARLRARWEVLRAGAGGRPVALADCLPGEGYGGRESIALVALDRAAPEWIAACAPLDRAPPPLRARLLEAASAVARTGRAAQWSGEDGDGRFVHRALILPCSARGVAVDRALILHHRLEIAPPALVESLRAALHLPRAA